MEYAPSAVCRCFIFVAEVQEAPTQTRGLYTEVAMKDGDITACGRENSATEVLADFVEGRRSWEEMLMQ